jgi:hypothetical protein
MKWPEQSGTAKSEHGVLRQQCRKHFSKRSCTSSNLGKDDERSQQSQVAKCAGRLGLKRSWESFFTRLRLAAKREVILHQSITFIWKNK